jgi:hypothetical protein
MARLIRDHISWEIFDEIPTHPKLLQEQTKKTNGGGLLWGKEAKVQSKP